MISIQLTSTGCTAMFRIILSILLSLSSTWAWASVSIVNNTGDMMIIEATSSYVMSENETRANAFKIAINKAKSKAISRSGSHHFSLTEMTNDRITLEHHQMVSSAIMSFTTLNEETVLTDNDQIKVSVTIRATISKAEFQSAIDMLRKDKAKAEEIAELNRKNEELKSKLLSLSALLQKDGAYWIEKERTSVIKDIDSNILKSRNSLSFDSNVMLSQANESRAKAFRDLDALVNHIHEHINVDISEPRIVPLGNGQTNVSINYTYDMSSKPRFVSLLNRVFVDGYEEYVEKKAPHGRGKAYPVHTFSVSSIWNAAGRGPTPYSDQLLEFLQKKRVVIEFSIDGYPEVIQVPVASMQPINRSKKQYTIFLSSDRHPYLNNPQPKTVTFEKVPDSLMNGRSIVSYEVRVIEV